MKDQRYINIFPKFISGLVSQTVTWPIEYCKIVRQLPGNSDKKLFTVLRNDYSKYGFRNLFKSMVPHAITSGPRVLVRLQTYEILKGSEIGEKSDVYRTVLAGGMAGAIEGSIVMAPSELVKVMLINHPEYSVWKCVSDIYSQRGFFGFYKGMTSTVMRHTINQSSSLSMYEWLSPQTKDIFKYNSLFTGVLAGIFSVYVTAPFDVIKTYQQRNVHKESIRQSIRSIYVNNGIPGFFQGAFLRSLRVGPLHSIMYFMYDVLKK
jgi:hypothetical protein